MKTLLAIFLLCATASASLPRPRGVHSATLRAIDGGKRMESVVIYRDGRRVRFIFTVPEMR